MKKHRMEGALPLTCTVPCQIVQNFRKITGNHLQSCKSAAYNMPCVIRQKEDNIDMKELSKIALAVEPSSTMAIDTLFKQMKAEGQDVIGFGAGEPDFNTPDYIKEAGIAAIEHNETRYTPSSGTVELRKAICQRLKADCGVEYTPQQISVSNGAKPCVYVALRALINPGGRGHPALSLLGELL